MAQFNVSRPGVAPRFPSPSAFVRKYERIATVAYANVKSDEQRLERFALGETIILTPTEGVLHHYGASDVQHGLFRTSLRDTFEAIRDALTGGEHDVWFPRWRRAVCYQMWAERINALFHRRALLEYKRGERPQKLALQFLYSRGFCIGNCLALGWLSDAASLADLTLQGIDQQTFNDASDNYGRRRTQFFVLQLINKWQGWPKRDWPDCAADEPIFAALLAEWSSGIETTLVPLLLAACDRHTHQSRPDTLKQFYDCRQLEHTYVPFEILSLLRLRESLGLENPDLNHVLMSTPLGTLRPAAQIYRDDILDGVIRRVRVEYPEL